MEIRVLKYFLMVAREENITKAANLLHITQPTLSRQLIQLEEELGVRLFHRSKHRVILTDDGMFLRRRAEEIVTISDRTIRDFLHKEENLAGEISIGVGEYWSSQFVAQLLASFRESNPSVYYELYSGNSDSIKERIEKGILDLGVLLNPVDITKYDFLRLPVKEEWGILVSKQSKLAQKECVSPQDLIHMPLMMTQREIVRNELTNWFGSYADQIEVAATGNLPYNLALLADKHTGVFINLKLPCTYEGLRYIPLSPKLETGTMLVWKKTQTFSPAVTAFLAHAKEYISSISND